MITSVLINVGTQPVVLAAATSAGASLVVANNGAASLYIENDSAIQPGSGLEIRSGQAYAVDVRPGKTLYGIADSGVLPVRVMNAASFGSRSDVPHRVGLLGTDAPVLVSAHVNAATLTLTFNKSLAASVPPNNAFEIEGSGSGVHAILGVPVILDDAITLTLATSMVAGEQVTVEYVRPGANPRLQDARGNVVSTFGPMTINNDTPGSFPFVSAALPQFPVISRGLPFTSSQGAQFGGPNAEANAIDWDYSTTWNSIFSPNSDGPQWYVLDLRNVAAAVKSNLWFFWKSRLGIFHDAVSPLGPNNASLFSSCPRDYKLQGHVSAGAQPAANDVGWVDLAVVVDNRYNAYIHTGLDLSTYNWFRFYCTASSGVPAVNDSVSLEFDLRDARGATSDSIFFFGDSITDAAFKPQRPGNVPWVHIGPIDNEIQELCTRVAPVAIDGGAPGWHASDGDLNKALYVGAVPCKYIGIAFGSNDANAAAVDLNTLGGVDSVFALAFKANIQSIVDYAAGLGKICIIPTIPWGDTNSFTPANIQVLNLILGQILASAANVGKVLPGPDLYTFYRDHPNCLADHLHPTYDETIAGGLYNGYTGYENYIGMWAKTLTKLLY